MAIDKVFIAGGGTMGRGIAQTCAQAGLTVILSDISGPVLDKALESIAWSVGKLVDKGRVKGRPEEIMDRISTTVSLEEAAGCDLAIEVVFEDVEVKADLLSRLSGIVGPAALMATNTSAIPITELAAHVANPGRFFGLHFFNPVPMMGAVEVIRGAATDSRTLEAGREFVAGLGKEPILVNVDCPGFVINRINLPSSLEAMRVVEEGVASVEDVDKGVRRALGRRMGIFETGDIVGLDVTHAALSAIHEETGLDHWRPPEILSRKVAAGDLGRKTGRGWYVYDSTGKRTGPAEN